MGNENKGVDGVTLIANAIRKEREEKARENAQFTKAETNVTDVMAQFTTGKPQATGSHADSTGAFSSTGQSVVETTNDAPEQNVVETTNDTTND